MYMKVISDSLNTSARTFKGIAQFAHLTGLCPFIRLLNQDL